MSTFMGAAWVDLAPGADVDAALAVLREIDPKPEDFTGWLIDTAGGPRIELVAVSVGYEMLADVVAEFLRVSGAGIRAMVALDHDEYGAEHIVLDAQVRRVHHVFVYPRDEDTNEPYVEAGPALVGVPAANPPEPSDDPGAVIDGPRARAAAAGLYEVSVEQVEAAAVKAVNAHRDLQVIGMPFAPWLDAFELPWIGETDGREVDV